MSPGHVNTADEGGEQTARLLPSISDIMPDGACRMLAAAQRRDQPPKADR
jgi:hypothetical protein